MKWLVALFAVVCVATAVTVVYVVLNERDTVPDQLIACTEDIEARRIVRADSLGPLRQDLMRDRLLEGETVRLSNGYRVVLLRPEDGSYDAVVLQRPDQFSLPTTEILFDRPSTFPLVAYGSGATGQRLLGCVDEVRAT